MRASTYKHSLFSILSIALISSLYLGAETTAEAQVAAEVQSGDPVDKFTFPIFYLTAIGLALVTFYSFVGVFSLDGEKDPMVHLKFLKDKNAS